MDHLRMMGFLVLLFTTLSSLHFAEARVLEHHFHNAALSQHNSAVTFDSDLDVVAVASSRQNYSSPGGHVANYSESHPGSSSDISTHAANSTIITVEPLQKETAGDGSSSNNVLSSGPSPGVGNAHTSAIADTQSGLGTFNKLSSGPSPGVGNGHTSAIASTQSELGTFNKLSSGPSPGVGNVHINAIADTQSELGTFNKLPSGTSPGVGHKVTNGYTEMAQDLESKKSAIMMNKLPSGPSPGVGNSATNGRNMMEKIIIESESSKKTVHTEESESTKKSPIMVKTLPFGAQSPGGGNSATNGRNTMEKSKQEGAEGMGIQTFNRLPSGPSPGVGHSYTNAYQPEKLQRASEDRKDSEHIPIFHQLPGGPSPGGGHSYVQKTASTVRMELSSNALIKTSSSPSRNSSIDELKAAESQKKKVEQTSAALGWKIGCDGGGLDFPGTPTPPMLGIAAAGSL